MVRLAATTWSPIRFEPAGLDYGRRNTYAGRGSVPDQDCFNGRLDAWPPGCGGVSVRRTLGRASCALHSSPRYHENWM